MELLELGQQLSLMERYKLTAEEVFLLELLFLASIEEGHQEYLVRYYSISKIINVSIRDLLISLQKKGIINKSFKVPNVGETLDPESIEFNKTFLHNYRKFSGELGKEFFNAYPSIAIINGSEAPLKNYGKKFSSEEDFYFMYGKLIGWNLDKHKHVLELISWGKENRCNLLNMNIADFVISKMWQSIEELRDGNGMMSFDTTTII